MKSWIEKIKHHHALLMILCCAVPLIILLIAVYGFGLNNKYLFWAMLLLCPLMHFFMMKNMHKGKADNKQNKGGCH